MDTIASMMFEVTCANCRKIIHKMFIPTKRGLTIAKGNCKSMKRDIAGKITSEVKGLEDVAAATAKELKATNTTQDVKR